MLFVIKCHLLDPWNYEALNIVRFGPDIASMPIDKVMRCVSQKSLCKRSQGRGFFKKLLIGFLRVRETTRSKILTNDEPALALGI